MRGIAQARNSPPSAAIVVDGVPMTQPAQFNQQMLDIAQIEVVKGPQGALYGRNAIGGAIIIKTKQPTDTWEGRLTAGYESGPGGKVEGMISGPVTKDLKIRAAAYYFNTQGHLKNYNFVDKTAKRHVDPVEDFSARFTALYTPSEHFTADLRLSTDLLNTRALYYVIPDFGTPQFNDPNYVGRKIKLNNSGQDARKIYDADLKLTYDASYGTFTSITGYNSVWEILTGDGYPFDPFGPYPINRIGFNYSQSQFLKVKTFTQEVRFTSPSDRRFRYIVGGQIFDTNRFISTGNMFDLNDEGVIKLSAGRKRHAVPDGLPAAWGDLVPGRLAEAVRLGDLCRYVLQHHRQTRTLAQCPLRQRSPREHDRYAPGLPDGGRHCRPYG